VDLDKRFYPMISKLRLINPKRIYSLILEVSFVTIYFIRKENVPQSTYPNYLVVTSFQRIDFPFSRIPPMPEKHSFATTISQLPHTSYLLTIHFSLHYALNTKCFYVVNWKTRWKIWRKWFVKNFSCVYTYLNALKRFLLQCSPSAADRRFPDQVSLLTSIGFQFCFSFKLMIQWLVIYIDCPEWQNLSNGSQLMDFHFTHCLQLTNILVDFRL
jgi:hypothetical protein